MAFNFSSAKSARPGSGDFPSSFSTALGYGDRERGGGGMRSFVNKMNKNIIYILNLRKPNRWKERKFYGGTQHHDNQPYSNTNEYRWGQYTDRYHAINFKDDEDDSWMKLNRIVKHTCKEDRTAISWLRMDQRTNPQTYLQLLAFGTFHRLQQTSFERCSFLAFR